MVGLPGAGKTARAKKLAAQPGALRLSPDAWMIPLFDHSEAGGNAMCWRTGSSGWPWRHCG
jgi:predicted kinase